MVIDANAQIVMQNLITALAPLTLSGTTPAFDAQAAGAVVQVPVPIGTLRSATAAVNAAKAALATATTS